MNTTYIIQWHTPAATGTITPPNCYSIIDALAAFSRQQQAGSLPLNAVVINASQSPS